MTGFFSNSPSAVISFDPLRLPQQFIAGLFQIRLQLVISLL